VFKLWILRFIDVSLAGFFTYLYFTLEYCPRVGDDLVTWRRKS
jgi:hypothetical protein